MLGAGTESRTLLVRFGGGFVPETYQLVGVFGIEPKLLVYRTSVLPLNDTPMVGLLRVERR